MVTPHIAAGRRAAGGDRADAAGPAPLRRAAADADRRRPDRAPGRPARASTQATHSPTAPPTASSASSRSRSPGKTGTAEKVVTLPGYPNPLELNQSWWCGYGPVRRPDDRRLRRDRERRPRRHRGGAGRAEGLRGVLPQARRPRPRTQLRLMTRCRSTVDARGPRLARRAARRRRRRRRLLAPARLGAARGASAALVGYGLVGDRRDHAARPRATRPRRPAGALRRASGVVLLVVAIADRPGRLPPLWRPIYGGTLGRDGLRARRSGAATRGSKRWIDIGFFTFQPSEFGKVLFALALAAFLADRSRQIGELARAADGDRARRACRSLLVFVQPDAGTALVYIAALAAVLFVAGVRWLHLALIGAVDRARRRSACSGGCRRPASTCSSRTRRTA